MKAPSWQDRIERASELVEIFPAASELLIFYGRVCRFQQSVFEDLRRTGNTEPAAVARRVPDLCAFVQKEGTATLADYACELSAKSPSVWEVMLRSRWEDDRTAASAGSAEEFFKRALLQPYAEYLASRGDAPGEGEGHCPFCGARPAAGVLRPEGDGAKRSLICSMCSTEWTYRRIVCPACAEADKDKLPVYKAEDIGYVRVEACDCCRCYLKSVDLTINGLAVPVVDELATVALNLWAEESGYVKLETNLLGL
jgi:FdhE protein